MTTRKLQELKAQLIEEYKAGKELSDKNYYVYERPNGTYQVRRKRENNKEPEPVETITMTEKKRMMKQWEKDKKELDERLKKIEATPVRVRKSKSPEQETVKPDNVQPAPDPSEIYQEDKEPKPHTL